MRPVEIKKKYVGAFICMEVPECCEHSGTSCFVLSLVENDVTSQSFDTTNSILLGGSQLLYTLVELDLLNLAVKQVITQGVHIDLGG